MARTKTGKALEDATFLRDRLAANLDYQIHLSQHKLPTILSVLLIRVADILGCGIRKSEPYERMAVLREITSAAERVRGKKFAAFIPEKVEDPIRAVLALTELGGVVAELLARVQDQLEATTQPDGPRGPDAA